jgi:hypothetical protein
LTHEYFGIIRQFSKGLVQRFVHFLWRALEKATAAADEESVASEDGTLIAILEEVANAILGVTWRVKSFHFDAIAD